jgi:chromosome segregation protein
LKRQAEAADLHARLERQTLETRWELARDDARERRAALVASEGEVAALRGKREAVERELEGVSRERQGSEDALSARSARREELSRRWFAARSAAERVEDRLERVAGVVAVVETRIARGRERLGWLRSQAGAVEGDGRIRERIAALEAELARATRECEEELASEVEGLERDRDAAARIVADREQEVLAASAARGEAERRLEGARTELAAAERRVEAARREAARVGSELAEVNRALRDLEGAPGAGATLADGLSVEPGYELALAAALDGRLRAALAPDRGAAGRLLDRSAAQGGRVIVAGSVSEVRLVEPPSLGATPLADRVAGEGDAAAIVRLLLRDAWIVDSIEEVSAGFEGVAVTLDGRAWSPRGGELRQAPAVGDEHMLAERNRREQLLGATERTAQEEAAARRAREQAAAELEHLQRERDGALTAYRCAALARDHASEQVQEVAAAIERRRAGAAGAGDGSARRAQLAAQLEAERRARERFERERREREQGIARLEASVVADEQSLPALRLAVEALQAAAGAIVAQSQRFERELQADRQAGEELAVQLRACAQREAALQAQLHHENEGLTHAEVDAQRARDRADEADSELGVLAARLELAPEPGLEPLSPEERAGLGQRLERLARRREQLGPVNPLAEAEYAEAVEHVEELEHERRDLETALRELETVIRDTDKQINECFERTFTATARNFEDVVTRLFPGGTGRLRLVAERDGPPRALGGQQVSAQSSDEDLPEAEVLGIEIELMPAGKRMQRLSLLSGGEKSLTALAFLFAVFLARPCPFYILDEVEAALDDLNIDRFLELLRSYSDRAQFIVVTHQKRTMEAADVLYGVVMGADGITKVISRRLPAAEAA